MAQPRSRFPAYPPDLPEGLQLYLEAIRKEIGALGVSGGASIVAKEGGVVVSTAANVLDFLGTDFDLTQSPVGEVNIAMAGVVRLGGTNVFTATNTFNPGPVIIGTDPGGSAILRVGGAARFASATIQGSGTVARLVGTGSGIGLYITPFADTEQALRISNAADSVTRHELYGNGNAFFAQGGGVVVTGNGSAPSLDAGIGGISIRTGSAIPLAIRTSNWAAVWTHDSADRQVRFDSTTTSFRIHHGTAATVGTADLVLEGGGLGAYLAPAAAGRLAIGTLSLPWGDGFMDRLTVGVASGGGCLSLKPGSADHTYMQFYADTGASTTRSGYAGYGGGGTINLEIVNEMSGGEIQFNTNGSLIRALDDFVIGSLGRFDSADTVTDQQLLVYKAGSINKWQAESIQFVHATGDFKAALLTDNTAITYVFLDPGTAGAAAAPNTPNTPIVSQDHLTHTLEIRDYVKTANFRYFEWEYCTGASCSGWIALALTTSTSLVHTRLVNGTVYRYRVRAVGRDGDLTSFATTGDNTATANSETHAFGTIIAGMISVANLAALSADFGVITAGQGRNAGNTSGINFGGAGGIPGTWTSGINFESAAGAGSMTRYINFTATGSNPVFKHELLSLNADGTAMFSGMVEIDFATTGAGIRFKDTGVAHGMTDVLPTDIYGTFSQFLDNTGGLILRGVSEDPTVTGTGLYGLMVTAGTMAEAPAVGFFAQKKSGTGVAALVNDEWAFGFFTGTSTLLSVITGRGQLLGGDGTATNPTWGFANDLDVGIYRVTTNELGLTASGTLGAKVTSTGFLVPVGGSTSFGKAPVSVGHDNDGLNSTTTDTAIQSLTVPANTITTRPDYLEIVSYGRLFCGSTATAFSVGVKFASLEAEITTGTFTSVEMPYRLHAVFSRSTGGVHIITLKVDLGGTSVTVAGSTWGGVAKDSNATYLTADQTLSIMGKVSQTTGAPFVAVDAMHATVFK